MIALDAAPALRAQAGGNVRIDEKAPDLVRRVPDVAPRRKQPIVAVLDKVRDAAYV